MRVEEPVLDRQSERGSVMELRAAERPPRVGVGVDVDHPDRSVGGRNGAKDRVGDGVIAASRERECAGGDDAPDERLDVAGARGDVEHLREADITDIRVLASSYGLTRVAWFIALLIDDWLRISRGPCRVARRLVTPPS